MTTHKIQGSETDFDREELENILIKVMPCEVISTEHLAKAHIFTIMSPNDVPRHSRHCLEDATRQLLATSPK